MTSPTEPLSRIIKRDHVPDSGVDFDIDVKAEELAGLAGNLDIPVVERASGQFTLTRWRGTGLAVNGRIQADVVQICVVTLEPVRTRIDEEVVAYFAPNPERHAVDLPRDEAGEDMEVGKLDDERIDIGVLMAEHLILGLEPYPRTSGVVFEPETDEDQANATVGAFAALSVLRGGGADK